MTVARTHGQIVHLHANCYAGTGRAPVPNNVAYDHLFSLLVYTNIAGLYEMRNVQLPSVTDLLIVGQLAPWIVSDLRDQYPSLRRLAVVVGRDTSHLVLNALSAFWKRDEDGHFTGAQLDVVTIFIGASIRKSFELKLVKLRNASGTHTQVVCISFPDSSLVLRWDARTGRTLAAAMSRAHLAGYIWDVPQLDERRFQLSTLYETREDPWSTMHL